jgi:V/A-type H+-transporting ATPase subunit K
MFVFLRGGDAYMTAGQQIFKRKIIGLTLIVGFVLFTVLCVNVFKAAAQQRGSETMLSPATTPSESITKMTDPGIVKFAFLAAAIAVSVGALGAGIAVGYVGAAAMGAIGEKPELAGRALIFVGLAEGIAIYGLIIAIMILGKV